MKNVRVKLAMAVVLFLAISAAVVKADLVSHWTFDEASGSIAYDSANSHHGIINGAIRTQGQIGGALSFDGSNDFVGCGNDSAFEITNELTVTAWVKLNDTLGNKIIVGKDDATDSRSFDLYFRDRTSFGFAIFKNNITSTLLEHGSLPSVNTWYHVAGVYKYLSNGNSIMNLYVNGILDQSTIAAIGPIQITTSELDIGRRSLVGAEAYMNGFIDDVRIYNNALTQQEIQTIIPEPATISLLAFGGLMFRRINK